MVIDFKCPQCGGGMEYDSEQGTLMCRSCSFEQRIEDAPEEKTKVVYEDEQEFFCNGCGAAIVTEPEVSATHCPYCGSAVAFRSRLTGQYAPDKVIPFTVSKEEAKQIYKKWAKNGILTPKDFMTEKRLGEITGLYVPFWLYDMNVDAKADCLCTKKSSRRQGDYIIQETKYYHVYRQANLSYRKVPADASYEMKDEIMDLLEPYSYEELTDFHPGYLAGFQAEKYGIDAKGLTGRVEHRLQKYAYDYIKNSINGYSSVTYQSQDCNVKELQHYYALLPVWILHYEYNGKKESYTMNGQTGKVVGKPPVSKARVAKWFSVLYGGSMALLALLSYLIV